MPVMPRFESALANFLQRVRRNKRCCSISVIDRIVCALYLPVASERATATVQFPHCGINKVCFVLFCFKNRGEHEGFSRVRDLELDGQTQEFCLGTPRLRTTVEEPSTPEMPDPITQDICKVCRMTP